MNLVFSRKGLFRGGVLIAFYTDKENMTDQILENSEAQGWRLSTRCCGSELL